MTCEICLEAPAEVELGINDQVLNVCVECSRKTLED